MKIGEFNPMDRKYWGPPEPGFSVKRNRQVIENSIKKYERKRKRQMADFTNKLRERTDAAATFLKSKFVSSDPKKLERYFGKTYLAYLRGEDIRNQVIRQRMRELGRDKEGIYKEKQNIDYLKSRALRRKGTTDVQKPIRRLRTDGQKTKKRSPSV